MLRSAPGFVPCSSVPSVHQEPLASVCAEENLLVAHLMSPSWNLTVPPELPKGSCFVQCGAAERRHLHRALPVPAPSGTAHRGTLLQPGIMGAVSCAVGSQCCSAPAQHLCGEGVQSCASPGPAGCLPLPIRTAAECCCGGVSCAAAFTRAWLRTELSDAELSVLDKNPHQPLRAAASPRCEQPRAEQALLLCSLRGAAGLASGGCAARGVLCACRWGSFAAPRVAQLLHSCCPHSSRLQHILQQSCQEPRSACTHGAAPTVGTCTALLWGAPPRGALWVQPQS